MALPYKDKIGYYGLIVKPSFEDALDAAEKGFRIPIPDRAAKRKALNFYLAKLAEDQKEAVGYDLEGHEHALSDETVPHRVLRVVPSPSADNAIWQNMTDRSQKVFENAQQQAMRHRVDAEAVNQMGNERRGSLSDAYFQGRGNPILQGEAPVEHLELTEKDGPGLVADGYPIARDVPKTAPRNLPPAAGRVAQPEFPTFAELNLGLVRPRGETARLNVGAESYETLRRVSVVEERRAGP